MTDENDTVGRRLIAARFKVSADPAWRKTTAEMLRVVSGPAGTAAVGASSAAAARSSIRCGKPPATRDRQSSATSPIATAGSGSRSEPQ